VVNPDPVVDPEPESEPDPNDIIDIAPGFTIDLRDVAVNNRWQAKPEEFWRIFETEQGWVLEINRDGNAGHRDTHDWEVVAENVDPNSAEYTNGIINYNLDTATDTDNDSYSG